MSIWYSWNGEMITAAFNVTIWDAATLPDRTESQNILSFPSENIDSVEAYCTISGGSLVLALLSMLMWNESCLIDAVDGSFLLIFSCSSGKPWVHLWLTFNRSFKYWRSFFTPKKLPDLSTGLSVLHPSSVWVISLHSLWHDLGV